MNALAFALSIALPVPQTPSCCSMTKFASDPAFIASHMSPLPLTWTPERGHSVTFKTGYGGVGNGFFVPGKNGSTKALILVHEWWGLNSYIKREAETLERETGYNVLAIDLYDGKTTSDPNRAGQLMQSVDDTRAKAISGGAVAALKRGDFDFKATKIGTIGFCFGGGWSYQTALLGGPRVQACVMFYGMPDSSPAAIAHLHAPVLFIQAKRDRWINDDVTQKFEEAMHAAGKPIQVLRYDADHAFANPSNPHYDAAATADAMKHALEFYRKYMGS